MSIAAGTSTTTVLPRDVIVYELKVDGSTVVRDGTGIDASADTALEGARVNDLDWSPSGNVLVMSVDDVTNDYHDDIWTLDLDDSATVNVTATPGSSEREPSWSPDGSQIVFECLGYKKEAKNSGLYLMDDDGSNKTKLDLADGRDPDWR